MRVQNENNERRMNNYLNSDIEGLMDNTLNNSLYTHLCIRSTAISNCNFKSLTWNWDNTQLDAISVAFSWFTDETWSNTQMVTITDTAFRGLRITVALTSQGWICSWVECYNGISTNPPPGVTNSEDTNLFKVRVIGLGVIRRTNSCP